MTHTRSLAPAFCARWRRSGSGDLCPREVIEGTVPGARVQVETHGPVYREGSERPSSRETFRPLFGAEPVAHPRPGMSTEATREVITTGELRELIREHKKRHRWDAIAALRSSLPEELETPWLDIADEIAFALGQKHRTDEAVSLLTRVFALEPTHRRASALAYLHYDALLQGRKERRGRGGGGARDTEADKKAFTRWMKEALSRRPDSIKDLYRLGEFEAQIQSQRDVAALRAFLRAIEIYRSMPAETRALRHDLHKPYIRCLYAGARSAYRLGRYVEARRLIFGCIREDAETDHLEPVHKLYLAGRVLVEQGQPEHAERAYRQALDARGPAWRGFIFTALAELFWRLERFDEAAAWIEEHIAPNRRSAHDWRLLGDIRRDRGHAEEAMIAYQNALHRDRGGRHLTLVRLGDLHRAAGHREEARKAFEQAAAFRRRHYLSDDRAALERLLVMAREDGETARADEISQALERLPERRRAAAVGG
jgi:tetratricopeptide (TPR) repeat protein